MDNTISNIHSLKELFQANFDNFVDDNDMCEDNFQQFLDDNYEYPEYDYKNLSDLNPVLKKHLLTINKLFDDFSEVNRFSFYKQNNVVLHSLLNNEAVLAEYSLKVPYCDDVTNKDNFYLSYNPFLLEFTKELLLTNELSSTEQQLLVVSHVLNGKRDNYVTVQFISMIEKDEFTLSNYYLVKDSLEPEVVTKIEEHIDQNPDMLTKLNFDSSSQMLAFITDPDYVFNLSKEHQKHIKNTFTNYTNKVISNSTIMSGTKDDYSLLIKIKTLKDKGFISNKFIERNLNSSRITFGAIDKYHAHYNTKEDVVRHMLKDKKTLKKTL
jgi:hypothetical protein